MYKDLKISLIVAVAENDAIGCENGLLYKLSADLKRFKELTVGHPVIMGRRTFESIGRPLPGRLNMVITRGGLKEAVSGVEVFRSVEKALDALGDSQNPCVEFKEPFIIGGGQIYREALAQDIVDELYLTRVHAKPQNADTFLPIDMERWDLLDREDYMADEKNECNFSFLKYRRRK